VQALVILVLHTLSCTDCGANRIGRDKSGGVVPYNEQCPECNSTNYEVLSAE